MDNSNPSSIWINIIIIIIVLALAVLFTLSEYSLVRTRRSALIAEKEINKRKTKTVDLTLHMIDHLSEYMSTAQVGITVTSLILGWVGEITLAELFMDIPGFSMLAQSHAIASFLSILFFTYIHAVFSDLVPKNIALDASLKVSLMIARPLQFFHWILFPLVWIMDRSAAFFTHLLGFSTRNEEEAVSKKELLNISETSANAGEIDEENVDFLKRAFKMSEKTAFDVMVDRTSMVTVDVKNTVSEVLNIYFKEHYSRIPVTADNDKDKILGYVYSYDLIRQNQIDPNKTIDKIIRNIVSIPENISVTETLNRMKKNHVPITIVVDEFGGTAGLISDKDIFEELFGQFEDEQPDNDEDLIKKLGDNRYEVSGKTSIYDFESYFKKQINDFNETDLTTISGYILSLDPDFRTGRTMIVEGFEFRALGLENSYIPNFEVTELGGTGNKSSEDKTERNKTED